MKIINQTIGRGIRHINDYCNIYLIDSRFAANNKKLPAWMTRNIEFIDYF
jgi:chromosome transmission fidelity protein 1